MDQFEGIRRQLEQIGFSEVFLDKLKLSLFDGDPLFYYGAEWYANLQLDNYLDAHRHEIDPDTETGINNALVGIGIDKPDLARDLFKLNADHHGFIWWLRQEFFYRCRD